MAQAEDTELRDLVVEALEKNGSLAKIRALLRANIFLAFEDECENPKQNESLDKILNLPDGKISLCIIHEFLEFCNLKNTLFVYMSETRQGKEYTYRKQDLLEKLNVPKLDRDKEPILLTIIKNVLKAYRNKQYSLSDNNVTSKQKIETDINMKDEQNCTYIVHEDTSSSSQSQSDNSSDEKNKVNLMLPLDNSDTDTSSDSARDKNSSEYIPNRQSLYKDEKEINNSNVLQSVHSFNTDARLFSNNNSSNNFHDIKTFNSSTESTTSYMELKPFNSRDELLLNTTGLPINDNITRNLIQSHSHSGGSHNESLSSTHTSSSSLKQPSKQDQVNLGSPKVLQNTNDDSGLNDTETVEYSYDFSPPNTEHKSVSEHRFKQSEIKETTKDCETISNHLDTSQSSISTADVIDLLSDKSFRSFSKDSKNDSNIYKSRLSSNRTHHHNENTKINSDNSSDFSESSIPSISNLSFEKQSD